MKCGFDEPIVDWRLHDFRRTAAPTGMTLHTILHAIQVELSGSSPLSMLSGCLDAAFSAASLIDVPQMQGSACLGWILMPEVQQVVTTYAERFLEQVATQVSEYCC